VRASTNTAYKQQTARCRVVSCGRKNNVHSNSILSNIYIMDEILLFDFQIAHLARSLTGRRQYMLVQRRKSRGTLEHTTQSFDTWCLFPS